MARRWPFICKSAALIVTVAGLLAADRPNLKGWGQAADPDGDCQFRQEGDQLTIRVPGKLHNLVIEQNQLNAPTVLDDIRGEFIALVKVTGTLHPGPQPTTPPGLPYNGTGLLLWQDRDNYVRLERAAIVRDGRTLSYANFELRKDGRLAYSQGGKLDDKPAYLRLERRGGRIYGAASQDGVAWLPFPPLDTPLKDELKLGVAAVNTSNQPFTAQLEGFAVFTRRDGANP